MWLREWSRCAGTDEDLNYPKDSYLPGGEGLKAYEAARASKPAGGPLSQSAYKWVHSVVRRRVRCAFAQL